MLKKLENIYNKNKIIIIYIHIKIIFLHYLHAISQLRQESLNLAILPTKNRYFVIEKSNLQKNLTHSDCEYTLS